MAQSAIDATYIVTASGNSTNINAGLSLDSTTAAPKAGSQFSPGTNSIIVLVTAREIFPPQLGLHFVQAMETGASNTNTITFFGAQTTPTRFLQSLSLTLDM